MTLRTYIGRIESSGRKGSEFASYEASYSSLDEQGSPRQLFDRQSGRLSQPTLDEWARFDLRRMLETEWDSDPARLKGKLHVFCGAEDTFFLDEAARYFCASLLEKDPGAVCEMVPGRTHGNIYLPAPSHPDGLMTRILEGMSSTSAM